MSTLDDEVFETVQAALLDSQCDPKTAVKKALQAVAQFASAEDVVADRDNPSFDGAHSWRELCDEAFGTYPKPPGEDQLYPITVNGESFEVISPVSYEKITELYTGKPTKRILTVVFSKGHLHKPEGSLTPGQTVIVKAGMRFNVADTSNA